VYLCFSLTTLLKIAKVMALKTGAPPPIKPKADENHIMRGEKTFGSEPRVLG
jgi:hypothetical protein